MAPSTAEKAAFYSEQPLPAGLEMPALRRPGSRRPPLLLSRLVEWLAELAEGLIVAPRTRGQDG